MLLLQLSSSAGQHWESMLQRLQSFVRHVTHAGVEPEGMMHAGNPHGSQSAASHDAPVSPPFESISGESTVLESVLLDSALLESVALESIPLEV